MARKCVLTGKKTISGNNRSHALNKTKRTWRPNLQKVTITVGGKKQTIYASANGLRTLRKHEAEKAAGSAKAN